MIGLAFVPKDQQLLCVIAIVSFKTSYAGRIDKNLNQTLNKIRWNIPAMFWNETENGTDPKTYLPKKLQDDRILADGRGLLYRLQHCRI